MARQSSKRTQYIVHCAFAVLFGFRAIVYLSAGASMWAVAYGVFAILTAYLAYRAYVSHRAIEAAWKDSASSSERPPDDDAYFKKCADCGKFTRDANACRHCGHDFAFPPTRLS
jgi:hypothetical protein